MSSPSTPEERGRRPARRTVLAVGLLTGSAGIIIAWLAAGPLSASPPPTPDEVRQQVMRLQRSLMVEGTFNCCIEPGCEFCPLAFGACQCAQRLASGQPVCPTCKGGIDAGMAATPGVSPDRAHAMTGDENRQAYEARRRAYLGR